MKKLLVASAVSALFAAPATVLAQAKPPSGPTLGSVLEASGINVSGHIDAGYTHADRNLEGGALGGVSTRVFDSQNNSFVLRQVGLTVAKQPKEGFGALVNITAGSDARVLNSTATGGADISQFDLTQAYAQYAGGPITVIAGKFTTLHGMEVIASPGNANISRSILFGSVPFTHTGLRATWAMNDQFSFVGGINNGWDQQTDANKGKTVELGAIMNPIKPLSITASIYSGKEPTPGGGAGEGTRDSVNLVATYNITDAISAGAEILSVKQELPGGTDVKYNGIALYGGWLFMPKLRGSLRLEQFDDKNGIRFGTAGGVEYREATATIAYLAADNFELRGEVRRDSADMAVFVDSSGATSKNLLTVALQVLYKF